MARIHDSILDTIGRTPLVRMQRLQQGLAAELVLKLESFNPMSSVKDRIGDCDDRRRRSSAARIKPGRDHGRSSRPRGNTGIALAFVCAARGSGWSSPCPRPCRVERRQDPARAGRARSC